VRIIVIGGAGTIGQAIVATLAGRHDVVVAGRRSGTVPVDIQSPDSVRNMFRQVGAFDALVCAAGEAHFGPFHTMSEDELALGIESKLLGQVRLVLLGRSLIADGGSFTLMSGYVLDDPIPEATSFAVANGASKDSCGPPPSACPVTSGSTRSARGWPPTATSSSDASTPAGSPSLWARSPPPSYAASRDGGPARSSGHGDHVAGGQMARQRRPPTG
jgi:NAD(P)-dependent dehydrogenase (short-subunit alcohol dehydrogenase family)